VELCVPFQYLHQLLGHAGIKRIQRARDMVDGLPQVDDDIVGYCIACAKGKQKKEAISKIPMTRSTQLLELIHMDVCGPYTRSIGGNFYKILFLEDSTNYTVNKFLKTKVAEKAIMEYIRWAERRTGQKVKRLRCDRGGEFISQSLKNQVAEIGIEFEFTASHSAHQNGKAERRHGLDNEMTRCTLYQSGLPKEFWAEASVYSTLIQNCLPGITMPNMTPTEGFTGKRPSLKDIGIFGCDADIMHEGILKKLQSRTYRGKYLGPPTDGAGARFYNPEKGSIVVSRNYKLLDRVTFTAPSPTPAQEQHTDSQRQHKRRYKEQRSQGEWVTKMKQ
jgi:transposase InsO family protein